MSTGRTKGTGFYVKGWIQVQGIHPLSARASWLVLLFLHPDALSFHLPKASGQEVRFHPPWKLPPVYQCILMEDTRPRVQRQRQITCHGKRCSKSRILCQLPKLQLLQAKEVGERERETLKKNLECKQFSSREFTILKCFQRRKQFHFISLSFQGWLLFRQAWTDSPRNGGTSWRIAYYY